MVFRGVVEDSPAIQVCNAGRLDFREAPNLKWMRTGGTPMT